MHLYHGLLAQQTEKIRKQLQTTPQGLRSEKIQALIIIERYNQLEAWLELGMWWSIGLHPILFMLLAIKH